MLITGPFGIANMVVPAGGPKVALVTVDFSNQAIVNLDGSAIVQQGKIEYFQGVYIDNSLNMNKLSLQMSSTNQIITIAAQSQGYFTIMVPDPPQLIASTVQANIQIPMFFYNVPIQPAVWKVI